MTGQLILLELVGWLVGWLVNWFVIWLVNWFVMVGCMGPAGENHGSFNWYSTFSDIKRDSGGEILLHTYLPHLQLANLAAGTCSSVLPEMQ